MPTDSTHLQEHIQVILKHEEEFMARRTAAERVGDFLGAFVGSLTFIGIHVMWFTTWILVNTLQIAHIPHFDPAPFSILDTVVAIEAIFLASFSKNRLVGGGKRRRDRAAKSENLHRRRGPIVERLHDFRMNSKSAHRGRANSQTCGGDSCGHCDRPGQLVLYIHGNLRAVESGEVMSPNILHPARPDTP
jgi:hypothetical protein